MKPYRSLLVTLFTSLFLLACTTSKDNHTVLNPALVSKNRAALLNAQLGVAYLNEGDIQKAKSKLLLAMQQNENLPEVIGAMAYYHEMVGEMNDAKKKYERAIRLSKRSGDSLNNYGAFLCRQGEYKESISYFLQAVDDPRYVTTAEAYQNAGLCALKIPNKQLAKNYFQKALEHARDAPIASEELTKLQAMH